MNTTFCRSNNPLVEGYDATKSTSYVNYFDAVSLYATSMCKLLPVGDFRFLSDEELASFDITKVDPTGSTGFMVQADFSYPQQLHDRDNCLPFAVNHLVITKDMLSEATIELGEKLGQKFRPQKKLVPTLYDKMVIYVTLQF